MIPQQFIQDRLRLLAVRPSVQSSGNIVQDIYDALMSKKFRKYRSTDEQSRNIKNTVEAHVQAETPLKIVWPFGAYKLWRFAESPEPDWAELFTLIHFARWLASVCALYKPGVQVEFVSDAVIIERMNNIPKADTDAYEKKFGELCSFMSMFVPNNLTFSIFQIGDLYTPEEFDADLIARMQEIMQQNHRAYRALNNEDVASIELNVKLLPGQVDDPLWREKVDLLHYGYYAVTKRRPYIRDVKHISVFFSAAHVPSMHRGGYHQTLGSKVLGRRRGTAKRRRFVW